MKAEEIFAQIKAMDAKCIPYHAGNIKPAQELREQLKQLGYTVGIGKGHKLVMRPLPEINPLPPCNVNF